MIRRFTIQCHCRILFAALLSIIHLTDVIARCSFKMIAKSTFFNLACTSFALAFRGIVSRVAIHTVGTTMIISITASFTLIETYTRSTA
jgi:hypothetical protein